MRTKREQKHTDKPDAARRVVFIRMKVFEIVQKYKRPNFTCDVCDREVFGGERICKKCHEALPWVGETFCPICGRKTVEAGVCIQCKADRPAFDRARSVFVHEGEAARLVVRLKVGEKFLVEALSQLLLPLSEGFPDIDAVAFVPMTERAKRTRGYNQSRLLAERVAEERGLELLDCLEKVKESQPQKLLDRKSRGENLRGCFRVKDKKSVKGRKILLVDDTMTTGATAGELASRLKRAGADKVYLMTITSVPYRPISGTGA